MNWTQYWKEVHEVDGELWKTTPHGWMRWKDGKKICFDLHCICGAYGHVDAECFYNYECKCCGRKYAMSAYVKMIELTKEQAKFVVEERCGFDIDPDARANIYATLGIDTDEAYALLCYLLRALPLAKTSNTENEGWNAVFKSVGARADCQFNHGRKGKG